LANVVGFSARSPAVGSIVTSKDAALNVLDYGQLPTLINPFESFFLIFFRCGAIHVRKTLTGGGSRVNLHRDAMADTSYWE
jgi:hypothetical protein